VQRFITTFGNTYFHAAGTCPMRRDTSTSSDRTSKDLSTNSYGVVDESLRVIGTEGLRIADASVVPLNGLPNAPIQSLCMVIGLKCAKLIIQD
jgi:choline dehydrogenase-like flavoprotein